MQRRRFLENGAQLIACSLLASAGAKGSFAQRQPVKKRVILVWSEGTAPKNVYPQDIRGAVAAALGGIRNYEIRTATLSDPDQGAGQAALDAASVLFWWGHEKHGDVTDATVERIVKRVREGGMGFVALHSSHYSKPFKALLNATGSWKEYVNDGKPQRITVADAAHPIARGVAAEFTIPREERYEEVFEVPKPDTVVLEGYYESTKTTARQGLCWTVGKGRVFYFRPGHEDFPVYQMPQVKRILRNAAMWAANDEPGIWEDNDPAARAARATNEPPLALILRDTGWGGTQIIAGGEVRAQRFVKAGPGPVKTSPIASYGLIKTLTAGWNPSGDLEKRSALWQIDAPNNKRAAPPLMAGAFTTFEPGDTTSFALWVSTGGFTGEYVSTDDKDNAKIKRFGGKLIHKARVYAAVKSDNTPVPNAYIIGWEYSTNDDFQDIVTLVENVRPV